MKLKGAFYVSISNDILREYLKVSRYLSDKFRVYYSKLKLTYPQSIVLTILQADGPMPISALAEATGSANSTISGVVDRLEKLGLAERLRSETDRRVIYVSTTQHFRDQFDIVTTSASDQFAQVFSTLSPDEQQTIRKGLSLFAQALRETEE